MRENIMIKEGSADKVEILKQTSIEKQRVLHSRVRIKSGHRVFKFDLNKKELVEATFTVDNQISFLDARKGLVSQEKEIDGEEGCLYVSALNKKNALKKIFKSLR